LPDQIFSPPLLVLCGLLLWWLRQEVRYLKFSPAVWTMTFALAFLSISLISGLISHYGKLQPTNGIWGLVRYAPSLLLLVTGFCFATRSYALGRLDALLQLLFWLSAIAAVSGYGFSLIPGMANSTSFESDAEGRAHGVFSNVNELGLQSGYPLLFGLVLFIRSEQLSWLLVGAGVAALGVLASFSKASMLMLGLLFLLATLEGLRAGRSSTYIRWTFASAGLAVLVGAFYLLRGSADPTSRLGLNSSQQKRVDQLERLLKSGKIDDETTTGRASIWAQGFNVWLESPLIGNGLTTFDKVPGVEMNAHNSILVVLGESGLLGLAFFGAMLGAWFTSLARCQFNEIRVLGTGFVIAQSALWMSSGQAMTLRGHNLVAGCVLGLIVMASLSRGSSKTWRPSRRNPRRGQSRRPVDAPAE
jgi:O-antigen ligase